jgi:ribosomal protein S18 acetylase RimI-like enzyme
MSKRLRARAKLMRTRMPIDEPCAARTASLAGRKPEVNEQPVGTSPIVVKMLHRSDIDAFASVASDLFDNSIDAQLVCECLDDPRHHFAVALEGTLMVGMASAVHYIHPDKPAQLFVNEVAVAEPSQKQGVGSRLLSLLLSHGREIGCTEAWVATDPGNGAARALYKKAGGQEDPAPVVMYTFPLRVVP